MSIINYAFQLIQQRATSLIILAGSTLITSCGGQPVQVPDDANYAIFNVQVSGGPGPGPVSITWDVVVRDDNRGGVSPIVSLWDDDAALRFGDDLLIKSQLNDVVRPATRGNHRVQTGLTLECTPVFELRGGTGGGGTILEGGGSGEGGRECFFCGVDEAEVYAKVSRADGTGAEESSRIDIDCFH
ncbi:hypothetical protein [Alkalimarinus coralli]|uniref:hypothetical protein n=1 Tax=Alkalimarinus coralli TaxID=2935863 RepID=UPI00202AE5EE|nr:hypothetical protein [Alkalimarinus coralli]